MTDLELMELLDESGYEPSLENLISLKEGIEAGKIEILDEGKGASIRTQQQWEAELNGECGEISEKRRAKLEGKFAKQREFEKKQEEKAKKSPMIKESYSDYELYKILDENGYTTTEKNLAILKEGLSTGKYEIE